MNMHFIQIDEHDFIVAHAFIESLKLCDKRRPLLRIGFSQQLFAFFPTQSRLFQNGPQGVATDFTVEVAFHPVAQFLQVPTGSGQCMVAGFARLDRLGDHGAFVLAKKGGTPPLC